MSIEAAPGRRAGVEGSGGAGKGRGGRMTHGTARPREPQSARHTPLPSGCIAAPRETLGSRGKLQHRPAGRPFLWHPLLEL